MPKIKVKDWQGLFTDVDQNDTRLELALASTNWRHEPGYIQFEPRFLSAQSGLPTLLTGFTWETGIYCKLASDQLTDATAAVATSYNCLILVAKALDSGTYYRRIHLYDGTNWHELSKNSLDISGIDIENDDGTANPPVMPEDFPNSYFSTALDQKAFFVIERGRLKLFLPHQSFWIGRLERTTNYSFLTHNDWYIDRLVEAYDINDHGILYNNDVVDFLPNGFTQSNTACKLTRRLGVAFTTKIEADPTAIVEWIPMNKVLDSEDWMRESDIYYVYRFNYKFSNTDTGIQIINDETFEHVADDPDDSTLFSFIRENSTNKMIFSQEFADRWLEPTGTSWGSMGTVTAKTSYTYDVRRNGTPGTFSVTGIPVYVISQADFQSQAFEWKVANEDIGFEAIDKSFELVITAVIDDNDEVIIRSNSHEANVTGPYSIEIADIAIPDDINKRITRLRFYYKTESATDFELVKEFDLLEGKKLIDDFFISTASLTNFTLSANIGFLFEPKKAAEYRILTGFKSFTSEADIGIGITTSDLIGIYYSTIGGGNLMTDILYSQSKLPVTGITNVKAVANINGRIGVFSDNTLYIVEVVDSGGLLTFTVNDTIEYGVKDLNDVAEIQGGILVNTRNGIFYTNGFETELVSRAINDVIRDNFDTGRIVYNKYRRELHYIPNITGSVFYRYRFERKVWEQVTELLGLASANDLLVDLNGRLAYLADTELTVYDNTDTTTITASFVSNKSDLSEPSVEKILNYIDIDYTGSPALTVNMVGFSPIVFNLVDHGSARNTEFIDMPLSSRRPFQKIQFTLTETSATDNTKIYGVELDFSLIKRRRYA